MSRVCVKAWPAFGQRRLHTNTDNIVFATTASSCLLLFSHQNRFGMKLVLDENVLGWNWFLDESGHGMKVVLDESGIGMKVVLDENFTFGMKVVLDELVFYLLGLLHDTRNFTGSSGNVFEWPPAQERLGSTLFNNWKNLASSLQEWRPDITGTTKRRESEMRREPCSTSFSFPHFQSGGRTLNHTGGTCCHSGMIDFRHISDFGIASGKISCLYRISKRKVNFKTDVCQAADPQITMLWTKEVEIANSIDELLTPRSVVWRQPNFPDFKMLDDCVSHEKATQHAVTFPKKSTCRRAACSEFWPILTRKADCLHDLRRFSGRGSLRSRTRSIRSIECSLTEWWRSGFRHKMGRSSLSSKWNTYGNVFEGLYK